MTRRYRFGRYDRLVIEGAAFREAEHRGRVHILQLVVDGVPQRMFADRHDDELDALFKAGRCRVDEGYYSLASAHLRGVTDPSDLLDLDEDELRTVEWKTEWCVRFIAAHQDQRNPLRPRRTPVDMARFIEAEKNAMLQWHVDKYGVGRPPGRLVRGERRKTFDYPSPSGLRAWTDEFELWGYQRRAFKPKYSRCGNRRQLHPELLEIVEKHVPTYAGTDRKAICDIQKDIEAELAKLNLGRLDEQRLSVSETAVRRRVRKLDALRVAAGRLGRDVGLRGFLAVGNGVEVSRPLERVEMDDWTMDLHVLLARSSQWRKMSKARRERVARVRCTVTIAIDVFSRVVLGYNVSIGSPSTATARTALRSIVSPNKAEYAAALKCEAPWNMYGRPQYLVTDGGPAFGEEFQYAVRQCTETRLVPEADPRMRGTIEAFFRRLKAFCRRFSGQAFADRASRGEYDGEANASLPFDLLERVLVRFIVDDYHNSPHRGLNGLTPISRWNASIDTFERPPDISSRQLCLAFGFHAAETLGAHGVAHLGEAYNNEKLNELFQLDGPRMLPVVVDPFDRGHVLVRVPEERRVAILGETGGEYLEVEAVDEDVKGRTLAEEMAGRADIRAAAKAAEAEGKPIVLAAYRYIAEMSEKARLDAGLPRQEFTEDEYRRIRKAAHRLGARARYKPPYADTARSPGDEIGTTVANSLRTKPTEKKAGPTRRTRRQKIEEAAKAAAVSRSTTPRETPANAATTSPVTLAPSVAKPFGGGFAPEPEDHE
jgi:transposase InsO family protein